MYVYIVYFYKRHYTLQYGKQDTMKAKKRSNTEKYCIDYYRQIL